jgi:diaminohydroxyphosphoribosylaminopyrimidine deaminase/5-amino-6-(5-phosphoribosylamino)uracil reductase
MIEDRKTVPFRSSEEERYMSEALELAREGMGQVSPNPMVGCVIVREGEVVGKGYHERYGASHAEVNALNEAGEQARDATLYVTLEPCAIKFEGKKTPPCVDVLLRAGIRRVVISARDPNPKVNGRGITRLLSEGLEVTEGILSQEGNYLVRGFKKWITTGRPYIILKAARTSDNFVAISQEGGRWFTSRDARRRVHQLRAGVDGILIGRGTAERDNPELTVRSVVGSNPERIVLDSQRRLPRDLRLFEDTDAPTLLFTAEGNSGATSWGEVIRVKRSSAGVDLSQVLDVLGRKGITSVMVEGGPTVHREFIRAGLADEMVLITSPKTADATVQQRPDLRNTLSRPSDWIVDLDIEAGCDRMVVARANSTSMGR